MDADVPVEQPGAGWFPLTRWSVVASARDGNERGLGRLCERYHPPVLAFFLAAGYSIHDAEDLTQGFFADILRRDFLRDVSADRGRFRTFLIRSLQHYLCDQLDKANALKRGGGHRPHSLHELNEDGRARLQPTDPQPSPVGALVLEWVRTIISNAFHQLERECERTGRTGLLVELEPVLNQDQDAPGYREIASRLGTTEGAVKAAAKRIRDRLQWLIRDQVKRTLQDESQCDAEIRELTAAFGASLPPAPAALKPPRPPEGA